MQTQRDSRMSPWRWWLLAQATPLAFSAFCLVTHSWAPLLDGWPIIAVIFALAVIRQSADIYEQRNGRRRAPHA
jgi:hypothetical protein